MFWFGRGILRQFLEKEKRKISPTEYLILTILNRNNNITGIEIIKLLKEYFIGIWEPKPGTIYPMLNKLEHRGFIISFGNYPKKYSITEDGKNQLNLISTFFINEIDFFKRFTNFVMGKKFAYGLEPLFKNNLKKYREWLKNELERVEKILEMEDYAKFNNDIEKEIPIE